MWIRAAGRMTAVCMLLAAGSAGCGDDGLEKAQFRVLTWNAGNCGDDGVPPIKLGEHNAADDEEIGHFVAAQAQGRLANVVLLQEITERATQYALDELGSAWDCQWRPFIDNGLATCVQGSLTVQEVGSFRHCGATDPAPPPAPYGTCPDYKADCGDEGWGYLQVRYKARTITNVHVQLGGFEMGVPGLARQQIVALHNDIVKSGIVGGDFNWVSPHDCSSLSPNKDGTTCHNDWHLATGDLGITLATQPGPDDQTERHRIDHIATVERPLDSPGVARRVLGYGQAHDFCSNQGCPDPNRPCSNHCMVFASFSLPPVYAKAGPDSAVGITPSP